MSSHMMKGEFGTKETGSWRTERPLIDRNKCTKCGQCIDFCPEGAMLRSGDDTFLEADLLFCKGCGICAEVCSVKAVILIDE